MKVLVDLNVLMDIFQRREPFYVHSARVLGKIARGEIEGAVPGHALTTTHYLLSRYQDVETADRAIDWLLGKMQVVAEGRGTFLRARSLAMPDFEDAVVAAAAEEARCDRIVTRNVVDFQSSPVVAVTPEELATESVG